MMLIGGRATKAALSGSSKVAVRNLYAAHDTAGPAPARNPKGFSSALRSVATADAVHLAVPAEFELRDCAQPLWRIYLMKTLVTFCQKTGRRRRRYINRQIANLSHTGQLKISVAFSLPFLAKLEVSYQA
jgi:hypothetical protein